MSKGKFNELISEYNKDGYNKNYYFSELGEGMIFCSSRTNHSAYLLNTTEKEVYVLVDGRGHMVGFKSEDIDKAVIAKDVDSDNASRMLALYRFWVYKFNNGQAEVEWTVMPDGRYFEDEDGYGAENCSELIATAIIDTHGHLLTLFEVLPRLK